MNWTHDAGVAVIYTEMRGLPHTARLTRTNSRAFMVGDIECVRLADGDDHGVPVEQLAPVPQLLPAPQGFAEPRDGAVCWPLTWPGGLERCAATSRVMRRGAHVTDEARTSELISTLDLIHARQWVISRGRRVWWDQPTRPCDDPAVAVWLSLGGLRYVFACDRYHDSADNTAAINATLQAVRRIERQSPALFSAAMRGFLVTRMA